MVKRDAEMPIECQKKEYMLGRVQAGARPANDALQDIRVAVGPAEIGQPFDAARGRAKGFPKLPCDVGIDVFADINVVRRGVLHEQNERQKVNGARQRGNIFFGSDRLGRE